VKVYNKYIDGNSTSGYLDKKVYIRLLRLEMMCPHLFLQNPLVPRISEGWWYKVTLFLDKLFSRN